MCLYLGMCLWWAWLFLLHAQFALVHTLSSTHTACKLRSVVFFCCFKIITIYTFSTTFLFSSSLVIQNVTHIFCVCEWFLISTLTAFPGAFLSLTHLFSNTKKFSFLSPSYFVLYKFTGIGEYTIRTAPTTTTTMITYYLLKVKVCLLIKMKMGKKTFILQIILYG